MIQTLKQWYLWFQSPIQDYDPQGSPMTIVDDANIQKKKLSKITRSPQLQDKFYRIFVWWLEGNEVLGWSRGNLYWFHQEK